MPSERFWSLRLPGCPPEQLQIGGDRSPKPYLALLAPVFVMKLERDFGNSRSQPAGFQKEFGALELTLGEYASVARRQGRAVLPVFRVREAANTKLLRKSGQQRRRPVPGAIVDHANLERH